MIIDRSSADIMVNVDSTFITVNSLMSHEALELRNGSRLTVNTTSSITESLLLRESGLAATGSVTSIEVSGATQLVRPSVIATSGAQIHLTQASSLSFGGGPLFEPIINSFVEAEGNGGLVDLSGITQMRSFGNVFGGSLRISSDNGGHVDLSSTANIFSGSADRGVFITSEGTGSSIDLSGLDTFNDNSSFPSSMTARDNGTIVLNPTTSSVGNVELAVGLNGRIVGGAIRLSNSATVEGLGTIAAAVENVAGIIQPGTVSPVFPQPPIFGTFTIDGDYSQQTTGRMEFDIAGANKGIDHDSLDVNGHIQLNGGILQVELADGFVSALNSTIDLLDFNTISGSFENLVLPESIIWDTTNLLIDGSIQVVGLVGDFDNNLVVDSLDLAYWESSFGMNDGADADADGDTDGADFLAWQRNLGNSLLAVPGQVAAVVPEPSSFLLLSSSCYFLCMLRILSRGNLNLYV